MVLKVAVLLGIQHLKKCGGSVPFIVTAELVDLVQHHERIAHAGFFQPVHDPARHSAHICAPVAADLRFVAHAAERQPDIFLVQGFRDRVTDRSLSCAGRSHQTQDRSRSAAGQLPDGEELEDSVFDLGQTIVIPVQDLLCADKVVAVTAGFIPGESQQRLNVPPKYRALGRLARKVLETSDFFVQFVLDFLLCLELLRRILEIVNIAQSRVLTQFLADQLELLAKNVFLLVLVDALPDLVLQILAD